MLSKLFESLYLKVYVNIVVKRFKSEVYIEICNKQSVVSTLSETFDTTSVNTKMHNFIEEHIAETPFFYISVLDSSHPQGASPTCELHEMPKYYDVDSSQYKCFDKQWSYYTSTHEINLLKHRYEKVGVDLIFSPFVLLANFFKDKLNSTMTLLILVEDNAMSLSIFNHSVLLYAEHLDMQHSEETDELIMEDNVNDELELELMDDSINLEEVDAMDDMDSLDDFGDIEDLDSIEDIDDFEEDQDLETDFIEDMDEEESLDGENNTGEVGGFNEDYQRFSLIQSSVNNFYQDSKYDSEFVESVYVADGVGVSSDLKRYLEEEMFLNVFVRHADLGFEVCEMAKGELR